MRIGKYTIIKTEELRKLQVRDLKLNQVIRWFSGWKDLDIIWDFIGSETYYGSIDSCRSKYAKERGTDEYGHCNHPAADCTYAQEFKALQEVERAARPLIRGLELAQEFSESTEKGWRRELKLQQALAGLDEVRRNG